MGKVDFGDQLMKKLKIYIDESGEFGFKDGSSDLYVVSMVMYDTSKNITSFLNVFNEKLNDIGYTGMIHMADLVMNRGDYRKFNLNIRRNIFNCIYQFARKSPIKIHNILINKKYSDNSKVLRQKILSDLIDFINDKKKYFDKFDSIILYYDNGQNILGDVIDMAFSRLNNYKHIIDFDKTQERLFQVADMLTFIYKRDFRFYQKIKTSKGEAYFFKNTNIKEILKEFTKKNL